MNHRDMTNQLYSDNNLDITMLKYFIQDLHSASLALIGGGMLPWTPYIWKVGLGSAIQNGLNPFYDHVQRSMYSSTIANPCSYWAWMFGYSSA